MKLYRCTSKGGPGHWIAAPDPETAVDHYLQLGGAKKVADVNVRSSTIEPEQMAPGWEEITHVCRVAIVPKPDRWVGS